MEKTSDNYQDERLDKIEKSIGKIRDNDLKHLQIGLNEVSKDVIKVSKDVDWLKRFFWIIVTASTGALVAGVVNLFYTLK